MNKISFVGRLAADAELKFIPSGDAVLSFRVASDAGFGKSKSTNWFACQVWGKRAESLQQYLTKGQQVTVWGSLTLRDWKTKEGADKVSPDIRVDDIALQGGKKEEAVPVESAPAHRSKPAQSVSTPEQFFDDDIPF